MAKPEILVESPDFSLVLGGPLFQLYRRAGLSGAELERTRRRAVVVALAAWLPLLLLALVGGHAFGGTIKVPFLYDIEAHVRFLIALPILIAAELLVHSRLRPVVTMFVDRRIVVREDIPRFHAAIAAAMRPRNSRIVEVGLLILVYTVGLWVWRAQIATGIGSWYATSDGSQWQLTLAGYWYAFVSIPLFQFILLRWYWRFFIWFQFLWRVSKLKLRLIATHPDRAAGLGFLGSSTYAFAPILFAQGALLAGLIASRVWFEGQDLMAFKIEAGGLVAFFTLLVLSPLLVFTPHLSRAKRNGLRDYGRLTSRYVQKFQEKWIDGGASREELLGSGDIQSLTDLGNSFAVVQETRFVPFGLKDAVRLAAATVAPLLPLTLTVISLEELIRRLIKILV
ncbi:MAG TPA: hypothetical protein VFX97_10280 [Pyrinomonadaceae bacterium]|nr:hypothetical protein [Pyrinomonadaceae bacterium]